MTVLNRHKHGIPAGAVYIGRGSKWGNPFIVDIHGTRDQVCDKYEGHTEMRLAHGKISLQELAELHGKDLVCYCAPQRCHGDYLQRKAAWAAAKLKEQS